MKNSKTTSRDLTQLYEGLLRLKTADDCKKFFRDLCTLTELTSMAERFKVVKLLDKGLPYREIGEKTGSSTATITRIAHYLHHGKGGYKLVLKRLK